MDSIKSTISEYFANQSAFTTVMEVAVSLLAIVVMWKLFSKAGDYGFKAIIPFYNMYTAFKLTMGTGWYFLLMFVPVINFIAQCLLGINTARSFGKGFFYGLGLIFIPIIFYPMLAFSEDTRYRGPAGIGYMRPDEDTTSQTFYRTYSEPSYSKPAQDSSADVIFDDEEFSTQDAETVDYEVIKND